MKNIIIKVVKLRWMETFKNGFQGGSVGLENLPDCSMYDCTYIQKYYLFYIEAHGSKIWIWNKRRCFCVILMKEQKEIKYETRP
jgi:hypothetical protein